MSCYQNSLVASASHGRHLRRAEVEVESGSLNLKSKTNLNSGIRPQL